MKIALITDAWRPQTNGVVRTLETTAKMAGDLGHDVLVLHPGQFRTFPCPTYPEIRLALLPARTLGRMLHTFSPDAVHIATEGPLGTAGRKWCRHHRLPFTTSYHTRFPEYLRARAPVPLGLSYTYLRSFHGAGARTMVATASMQELLKSRGFRNVVRWTRGVDLALFKPGAKQFLDLPRPILLYCGRVAVEKNIEAFLRMEMQGTKVVVGDGPARTTLQARYPSAVFTGYKYGEELAAHVAAADVFVFPSRTDTFGLVLLEAMACGVPIAAYPVTGSRDVVIDGSTGVLSENLADATAHALRLDPVACRMHALKYTWETATQQFLANLVPHRDLQRAPATQAFNSV